MKANEFDFSVVLSFSSRCSTLGSVAESKLSVNIQFNSVNIQAIDLSFLVVLFIMLYKMILTFESIDAES